MMPLPGAYRKPPLDGAPTRTEERLQERDAARREGYGLFGRHGVLREIAEMQMPLPMTRRPNLTGAPLNSDLRAAERREAKEARVRELLEESAEHAKLVSLGRTLTGSASAPVLPAAGAGIGLGPTPRGMSMIPPEDMEKQKLRLACKMETLSFLNGYHSAVGKMSMDQKASLLAKLHSTKKAKPQPAPCARTEPMAGESYDGDDWTWPEQMEVLDDSSVHQRLQHVNDACNQAFDFEAEL